MTPQEEAARAAAYAARHKASEGPARRPVTSVSERVRGHLRRAQRDALQVGQRSFWTIVERLPLHVRRSAAAGPAKNAVRWVRRLLGPRPPMAVPALTDGLPPREAADDLRRRSHARHTRPASTVSSTDPPRVAALVLTRNGAHHLRNLFASIEAKVDYPALEIRLVDHGSTDETRQVVAAHRRTLDLQVIWMPDNRSFSESTNRAARETNAPLLFLLNNDIIFTEDALAPMVAALSAPEVGMVGLSLRYPRHHATYPSGLQHGGIKLYPDGQRPFLRPYNLSAAQGLRYVASREARVERLPAVTAACALVRRAQFFEVGGLEEAFDYGYEDVDFALKLRRQLGLESVLLHGPSAVHDESATQNRDPGPALRARRAANRRTLQARHGRFLTQSFLRDKRLADRMWSDEPLVVAFAVSEVGPHARAGDLFTAAELGAAMEETLGWRTVLKPKADGQWYDMSGVDVVVGLVHQYDPRAIRRARPNLLKIGWVRNWFAEWPENPGFVHYDLVLTSSQAGADYLLQTHGRRATVLPIGTSPARFAGGARNEDLAADVVFTGSRWGADRDIETNLKPATIHGTVALYGAGWSEHETLGPWARGFVPYARMKDVYASTRIVIDDCISVARPWGSVNSRVFDALSAGALVVTNCAIGSQEQFDGELPTYDSTAGLTEVVNRYLDDEPARRTLVERLRARILDQHTYTHRARTFADALASFERPATAAPRIAAEAPRRRVAIKVPVASNVQDAPGSAAAFIGAAIRKCLQRQGHAVRVDALPHWYDPVTAYDDIVIVLRGDRGYAPRPHQATVIWTIDPAAVTDEEREAYDAVFVASNPIARELKARLRTPVAALLLCTDPDRFAPVRSGPHHDVLFVGSAVRQRPIVMDAIAAGLPLSVYGCSWTNVIDRQYIRAERIPDVALPEYYGSASVILTDHRSDSRTQGFLSCRLFDVAACGTPLVTDPVVGLHEVFGDAVKTYETVDDLRRLVQAHHDDPRPWREAAEALASRVRAQHTFARRTEALMSAAERALADKL